LLGVLPLLLIADSADLKSMRFTHLMSAVGFGYIIAALALILRG
jgi:hypothetical protein